MGGDAEGGLVVGGGEGGGVSVWGRRSTALIRTLQAGAAGPVGALCGVEGGRGVVVAGPMGEMITWCMAGTRQQTS